MIFNIKLKTKNGNDVKKKQTITVFFALNFKAGVPTIAEYTYRIVYGNGKVLDPGKALTLRDTKQVSRIESLTLRVLLNLSHLVARLTEKYNIDPDFVLFISPDLDFKKNNSWKYLKTIFKKEVVEKEDESQSTIIRSLKAFQPAEFNINDPQQCGKLNLRVEELRMLDEFVEGNPNTHFMAFDPNKNVMKYGKSIAICNELNTRFTKKY